MAATYMTLVFFFCALAFTCSAYRRCNFVLNRMLLAGFVASVLLAFGGWGLWGVVLQLFMLAVAALGNF